MELFNKIFTKKKNNSNNLQIDNTNIPSHIAIIMDGNGRWAKKRGLPRTMGHRAGVEALRDIIRYCGEIKVGYLSLYAFSTENWSRPNDEVSALMGLVIEFLQRELQNLNNNNVKINILGELDQIQSGVKAEIVKAVDLTFNNTGLNVNIAFNYGGRAEIINAVKAIAKDVKSESIDIDKIDEECFSSYLYTQGMPDPDLIIRPSGELRISNFLLWQMAYSEFWFSDVLWPDFKPIHLKQAIIDYQKRNRRFGKI